MTSTSRNGTSDTSLNANKIQQFAKGQLLIGPKRGIPCFLIEL